MATSNKIANFVLAGVAIFAILFGVDTCRDRDVYEDRYQSVLATNAEQSKEIAELRASALSAVERADNAEAENAKLVEASKRTDEHLNNAYQSIRDLKEKEKTLVSGTAEMEFNLRSQISEYAVALSMAIKDRDDWKTVAENRLVTITDLKTAVLNAVDALDKETTLKNMFKGEYEAEHKRADKYRAYLRVGGVAAVVTLSAIAIF